MMNDLVGMYVKDGAVNYVRREGRNVTVNTEYSMLHQFLMTLQTEILSIETSDFPIQIIFLSFYIVLIMFRQLFKD